MEKSQKKPASGEAGIWWLWLSRDMKGETPKLNSPVPLRGP